MAICMAKTIKEERLRWVLPIANKEVRLTDAAKICPYGKRSMERWLSAFKKENLVRKYRVKKIKYKYIRAERKPGELIEIDVKYVPGPIAGCQYFQYTAIDTASRWRHMEIYDEQATCHSIQFLQKIMTLFPRRIMAIKTDNHSTFTNYYVGTN